MKAKKYATQKEAATAHGVSQATVSREMRDRRLELGYKRVTKKKVKTAGLTKTSPAYMTCS